MAFYALFELPNHFFSKLYEQTVLVLTSILSEVFSDFWSWTAVVHSFVIKRLIREHSSRSFSFLGRPESGLFSTYQSLYTFF